MSDREYAWGGLALALAFVAMAAAGELLMRLFLGASWIAGGYV